MLNNNWLRLALLLILAIALPLQSSAATMMSISGSPGPQSGAPKTERLVTKQDCHGQIVQADILVPLRVSSASTQTSDDDAGKACPHCSLGCGVAGITFFALTISENTPSVGAFAPHAFSFLSFIGRVPEHPPKG